MAMMTCPECGKKMNSAPGSTCPSCGYKVPKGGENGKKAAPDRGGRFGKKAAPEKSSSKKMPPAKKRTY